MSKKSMIIMLAGITLFAACSAPKYTYNFGHYKNSNAKLKEQSVATPVQTEVSNPIITPAEKVEVPVYANISEEPSTVSVSENAGRINERIESLQAKADRVKHDLSLTKSDHKAAKKELRREVKTFAKEIKKNPLHDESANADGGKNQLVALLLAIFLGGLGIHDFYLGRVGRGILKIVLAILGFLIVPLIVLGVWVLVDIILIAFGVEKPKGGEYSKTL